MTLTDRGRTSSLVVSATLEKEGNHMKRGRIDHYFQQDGDHVVHIIPENGIFNVYYQIDDSEMKWAIGLPVYQEYDDKYYTLDEIFEIAWNNFPNHEYMFEDDCDE